MNIQHVFKKPLIVGASISADWHAPSPGRVLARRYSSDQQIRTWARAGRPGREVLANLPEGLIEEHSVIVGLDLFFWDSFDADPCRSREALRQLEAQAHQAGVPLVIGDVPELVPFLQLSRDALNEEIHRVRDAESRFYRIGLDKLYRELLQSGGVRIGDRLLGFRDLVPDGLHINSIAAEYLADRIFESLTADIMRPESGLTGSPSDPRLPLDAPELR